MKQWLNKLLPVSMLLFGLMHPSAVSAQAATDTDSNSNSLEAAILEEEKAAASGEAQDFLEQPEEAEAAEEDTETDDLEAVIEEIEEDAEDEEKVADDVEVTEDLEATNDLEEVVNEQVHTDDEEITADEKPVAELHNPNQSENVERPKETPDFVIEKDVEEERQVRVVIELDGQPLIEEATRQGVRVDELDEALILSITNQILSQQLNVKQNLEAQGIEFATSIEEDHLAADDSFTVTVNAFVTYVKASDIEKIKAAPGVRGVYEAVEYERPQVEVDMLTSNDMIKQPEAQDLGYKGEGQVIAVIDSGTDPSHPDLQNLSPETQPALTEDMVESLDVPGEYVNEKVPYAYNYYDLNGNYIDIAESGHHGQHVAGTVGANGLLQGVAPESQILGMKVFSDDIQYATTFSDVYLRAIEDAILLGADVINMSLGSPAGFYTPGSIEDIAVTNALNNGVIVAISAGNENQIMEGSELFANYLAYPYPLPHAKNPDIGLVGSPSINEGSISVSSVDNAYVLADKMVYTVDGQDYATAMQLAAGAPDPATTLPGPQEIIHVGEGSASPGALADWEGLDVTGKVALVQRGNTFTDTIAHAQNFGAVGLIIYNHADGGEELVNMAGGDIATIPFLFIGHQAGTQLANAVDATVTFTDEQIQSENPTGWRMSDFSSWGTGPNLEMKPELTAPGGQIYSLQNDGQYGSMSGTSMAAPHVAGGAALVQQRIKLDEIFTQLGLSDRERADLTKALLMNTADLLFDEYGYPYFVRQQGAGLMDLEGALTTEVVVVESHSKTPKVELGNVLSKQATFSLDFVNLSNETKYYRVDSVFLKDLVANAGVDLNLLSADYLNAELIGPRFIEVAPNSKANPARYVYTLDFSKDTIAWNNFVEGFLQFHPVIMNAEGEFVAASGGAALQMPVLGFYGNFDEPKVIDEFVQNLANEDPATHPTFTLTTPVQYDAHTGNLYFRGPNDITYMNPGSEAFETTMTQTFGFMATMLRNARQVNFRILDENFNTLQELDSYYNQRKITYMSRGQMPFTFFQNALWDGMIGDRPLADNEVVYYEVEFLRTESSTPEVYRFKIVGDNTAPTLENVEVIEDGEQVYLSFSSTDTGSGGDAFAIYRLDNDAIVLYDLFNLAVPAVGFDPLIGGPADLGYNENLMFTDTRTDFFVDVTSLLTPYDPSYLYLRGYDVVGNVVDRLLDFGPLGENFGEEEAAAPVVDPIFAHHQVVTGTTDPYSTVVISLTDATVAGSGEADANGNFAVAIAPQKAGTNLVVQVQTPRGFVSELAVVEVQKAPAAVDVEMYATVDGYPANIAPTSLNLVDVAVTAISTDGKYAAEAENVTDDIKAFNNLYVGDYFILIENLPENIVFTGPERLIVTKDAHLIPLELTFETVEEDVREPDANTQAQIVLNTPDLLTAYRTNEIQVSGLTYGLDNIESFYAGDQEIALTKVDNYSVVIGGSEVFYGTVYTFDETIFVEDGYHEMPFTVSNGNPAEDFSIVRRFWVDTTPPEFNEVTVGLRRTDDSQARITLELSDNLSVLTLRRNGSYLESWDETANGFDSTNISATYTDLVDLELGMNELVYTLTDLSGNVSEYTVWVEYTEKAPMNELYEPIADEIVVDLNDTNELPAAQTAVANADAFPEGTTFAYENAESVDLSGKIAAQFVTVVVTYADGTQDRVHVPVSVIAKEGEEEEEPESSKRSHPIFDTHPSETEGNPHGPGKPGNPGSSKVPPHARRARGF